MRKYEVYENNGGGITMYVWDRDGQNIVYAHSGYEYVDGQLLEDIKSLEAGDAPETDWDGNGIYYGNDFASWEDAGLDISDVYEEDANHPYGEECSNLIADNDGIYPGKMGSAGRRAFCISTE
jgi:hypothetical protein